jgi:hypothetical protein
MNMFPTPLALASFKAREVGSIAPLPTIKDRPAFLPAGANLKLTNIANVDGDMDVVHNKRRRRNISGATSIGPTGYKPSGQCPPLRQYQRSQDCSQALPQLRRRSA